MSKRGRPKTGKKVRSIRVSGYITEDDAVYIREVAEALGLTSTSELITAILERLCIGGFSGLVFVKLGWMFANANPPGAGLYFGLRPLPPLADEDDPDLQEFRAFLREVEKQHQTQTRKENDKC